MPLCVLLPLPDMHHVNKGSIGLFAQGTAEVDVFNLNIRDIKNYGRDGERSCGAYEVLHLGGSVPDEYPALPGSTGYSGQNAYGMVLSAVTGFRVHPGQDGTRSRVKDVWSGGALATGVMVSSAASDVDVASLDIRNVDGKQDLFAGAYPGTCRVRVLNAGTGVHVPGGDSSHRDGHHHRKRSLLRTLLGGGGSGGSGGGGGGGGGSGGGGDGDGGDSRDCNIFKYAYPGTLDQEPASRDEMLDNFFHPERHCRDGRRGERC